MTDTTANGSSQANGSTPASGNSPASKANSVHAETPAHGETPAHSLAPLSLLDFATVFKGERPADAFDRSVQWAQQAEKLGFERI